MIAGYFQKSVRQSKNRLERLQRATDLSTKIISENPSSWFNDTINLKVPLGLTRHRKRIIRLQPALNYLQNNLVYSIAKGNDDSLFKITTKNGVTSLHFSHRIKHPGIFNLEIVGNPIHDLKEQKVNESATKHTEGLFHINLHIQVIV